MGKHSCTVEFFPENFSWDQCYPTLWTLQILNPVEKLHSRYTLGEDSVSVWLLYKGLHSLDVAVIKCTPTFCRDLEYLWNGNKPKFIYLFFIAALDKKKTLPGTWRFRQCCTYWCWSVLGATTSFCLTAPQQSCCIISWSCRHWKMSQHSKNSCDLLPIDQTWNKQQSIWSLLDLQIPCLQISGYSKSMLRVPH